MTLFDSVESRRSATLLGWPTLTAEVASFCSLERGAARVRASEPTADADQLQEQWAWYDELLRHEVEHGGLSLGSLLDLRELFHGDERAPGPLSGEELAAVGAAALGLADLDDQIQKAGEVLGRTRAKAPDAGPLRPLGEHLMAALEPDGRLKDGASPRLASLRQQLHAAQSRLRDTARGHMRRAREQGWATADDLALRGERYCIPVRSGSRQQVPGIVHDRSGTGGTLFVEPMEVVEAGNEAAEARLAVREEEQRILLELHRRVSEREDFLLRAFDFAVEVDALRARVRWGRRFDGRRPDFDEGGRLHLRGYRHPPLRRGLEAAGRGEELVPLDLLLEDDRLVLLSGPNAGGKTLVLKSVGLAALMAQSIIPVPAAGPVTLPVHDRVLLELGDDQSIEDALSSFSAHLTHLRRILDELTPRSLTLLDELGGGTDPQEGVALAWAYLEELARRGCRTLATTHYGQLKSLVERDERFRHASMAFDPVKLVPRFSLELDLPGASHALEIAERLELPPTLLERARELVGDERLELETLLRDLHAERDRYRDLLAETEQTRDRARLRQQDYERRVAELKEKRREKLADAEKEAEGILRNARRKVENLLSRVREAGADEAARQAAREARRSIEEGAERLRERRQRAPRRSDDRTLDRVAVGDRARHRGLGKVGEVVEVQGRSVTLEVRGTRVVAKLSELAPPDEPIEAGASGPEAASAPSGGIRTQLADASAWSARRVDVRGEDVEEAWRRVDRALDRAVLSGLSELEVIHGKGTGTLRSELGRRLKTDRRVRSAAVGGGGRYDDGVTLVEL